MKALETGLTSRLIASDLFSCDNDEWEPHGIMPDASNLDEVHSFAKQNGFSCVPLYEKKDIEPPYWFNKIFTFDRLSDKNSQIRDIAPEDIISSDTPIPYLIKLFLEKDFYLVLEKERICKIITISDLNKLPVRVCLLTMIAHLEGLMSDVIDNKYPNDAWFEKLGEQRKAKIIKLYEDKKREDFDVSMIDCTMITDKFSIIRKTDSVLELLNIEKSQYDAQYKRILRLRDRYFHNMEAMTNDSVIKSIETLRDHVAHNQILKRKIDIAWLSQTVSIINDWIEVFSEYNSN